MWRTGSSDGPLLLKGGSEAATPGVKYTSTVRPLSTVGCLLSFYMANRQGQLQQGVAFGIWVKRDGARPDRCTPPADGMPGHASLGKHV